MDTAGPLIKIDAKYIDFSQLGDSSYEPSKLRFAFAKRGCTTPVAYINEEDERAGNPVFWVTPEYYAELVDAPEEKPVVGVKHDSGKPRPMLLQESLADSLLETTKVLTYGANKYSDDNWKNVDQRRYFDALYRHLNAHHRGELKDTESGLLHLAHAASNILIILQLELMGKSSGSPSIVNNEV